MATNPLAEPHGALIIDKSNGPTSHDVVAVARRTLGTRQIGHTGTLDPMATGVLVLVVGEATKLVNLLGAETKTYRATLKLGVATHTLDAEGEVTEQRPVPVLDLNQVRAAAAPFVGSQMQLPPLVSAIKVGGKSMHKRVRAGEAVELAPRPVRLDALEVEALQGDAITLTLTCSKGYYVRALARDLAAALGTVGHLSALQRTRNGPYSLHGALSFEALRAAARGTDGERAEVRARLLPLRELCMGLRGVTLDSAGAVAVRHGRRVAWESVCGEAPELNDQPLIAFSEEQVPLAIMQGDEQGLRVLRGFRAS